MTHMLNRTKEYMVSLKQGKISDKSSTVRILYLFIRRCSRPKAHSYMAKSVLKLNASGCLLIIGFVSLENPD